MKNVAIGARSNGEKYGYIQNERRLLLGGINVFGRHGDILLSYYSLRVL